jgi:hypothetical protein
MSIFLDGRAGNEPKRGPRPHPYLTFPLQHV